MLVAKIQQATDDQTGQDDKDDDGHQVLKQLANLGPFGGSEASIRILG